MADNVTLTTNSVITSQNAVDSSTSQLLSSDSNLTKHTDSKQSSSLSFEDKMTERKQRLDEARFRLEERKAIHDMDLETQKELFAEKQANVNIPDENWMKTLWRPAVSWVYIVICAFDFLIFPAIQFILPIIYHIFGITLVYTPWVPITLGQNGLFHVAMGAIVGVNTWSRGQEKMAQTNSTN